MVPILAEEIWPVPWRWLRGGGG